MKQLQTYEYELKYDGEEECFMCKSAGACRFVFNKALAIQIENYEAGNKYISYVSMAKQLTAWRNSPETPWLSDAPCHSLQHALKDLDRAFNRRNTDVPLLSRVQRFSRRRIHPPRLAWNNCVLRCHKSGTTAR